MEKLEELITLIEYLKKQKRSVDNEPRHFELKLDSVLNELKILRSKFLEESLFELRKNIKLNYNRLRISALSLMEYDFHENSHSNILEYLMDYNSYEKGADILCQLVKDSSDADFKKLQEKIFKKNYLVKREYIVTSGRIDLFILDKAEKFLIIIENKILANVGSKIINEEENIVSRSQLQVYENWCKKNYPDYNQSYILLHLSNTDEDTSLFARVSYDQLYQNLKMHQSEDNILNDYLLLLESMINPTTHDLLYLKKLANTILQEEQAEISLVDYYTLKNIFYVS